MPDLSRIAIRCALINLVIGLGLGAAISAFKGIGWPHGAWQVLGLHVELLLFGWTAQLAMAVAYWIIPRIRGGRPRSELAVGAFILINLGAWISGLGPMLGAPPAVVMAGRIAEAAAAIMFALHAWPRVRPPGASAPIRPKAPSAPSR